MPGFGNFVAVSLVMKHYRSHYNVGVCPHENVNHQIHSKATPSVSFRWICVSKFLIRLRTEFGFSCKVKIRFSSAKSVSAQTFRVTLITKSIRFKMVLKTVRRVNY